MLPFSKTTVQHTLYLLMTACAIAGVTSATASAAQVSVVDGHVQYDAAPGERNRVAFDTLRALTHEPGDAGVWVADRGAAIAAGAGCRAIDQGAVCTDDDEVPVVAHLGDGDDVATDVRYPGSRGIDFDGGPGNDTLSSGPFIGGPQRFEGGPGNDTISSGYVDVVVDGGDGADKITIREAHGLSLAAGDGNDLVSYDTFGRYPDTVTSIDLGAGADRLTLGVTAMSEPRDTPYGTFASFAYGEEAIVGGPGLDVIRLLSPDAVVFDLSRCACGIEAVDHSTEGDPAQPGDLLVGSAGTDFIKGSKGPDTILPGGGADLVSGGPGDDRFVTSGDGATDIVQCGAGDDLADADDTDVFWGVCERRGPLV